MEKKYDEIIEVLKNNNSFLIASHAHPDGDGIGSTLALGELLKSMGKEVHMYNQDGVPQIIDFLAGADQLVDYVPEDKVFDVAIMADCSSPERSGKDFPPEDKRKKIICIDHHVTGSDMADVACINGNASSTGEIVYNIMKRMDFEITPDIATQLLTTIIVDTNFFRYSNTSTHALNIAAELVSKGGSTWVISRNMEERVDPAQLKLLSMAIDTIEYPLDGQLAIMVLTDQMFERAGAGVEMAEEFINFPRSIKDIRMAALIRERGKDEYKISFRSKGSVDVAKLAVKFKGGGHEHAAGCTMFGKLGTVRKNLIDAVEEALKA